MNVWHHQKMMFHTLSCSLSSWSSLSHSGTLSPDRGDPGNEGGFQLFTKFRKGSRGGRKTLNQNPVNIRRVQSCVKKAHETMKRLRVTKKSLQMTTKTQQMMAKRKQNPKKKHPKYEKLSKSDKLTKCLTNDKKVKQWDKEKWKQSQTKSYNKETKTYTKIITKRPKRLKWAQIWSKLTNTINAGNSCPVMPSWCS